MDALHKDNAIAEHIKICSCNNDIFPINARKILNTLGDMGTQGWFDWHLQENFEYLSPGFWQFLGYIPENMPHKPESWMKLINQDDLVTWSNDFTQQCKDYQSNLIDSVAVSHVVRYTKFDGSTAHVICQGRVIEWDEKNQPKRMIGTHTDVTKRVKIAETLRKEQEMIKDFFYSSPTGLAVCTPIGNFISVNNAFCQISGHTQESLLTKNFRDITHPDDLQKDINCVQSMLDKKIDRYEIKKRYIKNDGTISWVHLIVVASRDQQGTIEQFFVQIIDINDDINKSKKIVQSIQNIQGLFEKQNKRL